jgi:aminoglycoside phosphotransferase family enzyme/predicted kinase
MQLTHLIDSLSDPAAYSHRVAEVEVRHTHISVVFLAGRFVYKIKKPLQMGFLDFRTLSSRRHFCEEEVRLNRRLAPSVYLGVVKVVRTDSGLRVEGSGEAVEWAVKMERLPDNATLRARLTRGEVGPEQIASLARRIASFHAAAEAGQHISAFGALPVVASNARENFEQSAPQVGTTVSPAVFDRLRSLTEKALDQLGPLIEARSARGVPRDTHGDLHCEHVYLFPDRPAPDDVVIIDCIEFNERFRFADPVADMAFLVMDLTFEGRRDLARHFAQAWFAVSGDEEGRALLPFFMAYRAAVRGKVEGLELGEREIPEEERAAALSQARGHWLLALGQLETPAQRPCLVLAGGLPGTGKSTQAHGLAERAGFCVVSSDVVRKQLAGVPQMNSAVPFETGIYTPEWTERTYAECLRRAEALLFEGKRVVMDATFREEKNRRTFLEAARQWGVPGIFLVCRADTGEVNRRLESRRGGPSDANRAIHQELAQRWQTPGGYVGAIVREIDTQEGAEQALTGALEVLRECELQG